MSKELIERLRSEWRKPENKPPEMLEAADRIEQLEAENAFLERKIEYLELCCEEEFAVSQAYKCQLQNTFEELLSKIHRGSLWLSIEEVDKLKFVLLDKSDTTALESMIAKAGEVMRDRCIDNAQDEMDEQFIDSDPWYAARSCRDTIRDIPTITLNDLK